MHFEQKIKEAGSEGGLRLALEGRLEGWHTRISDWLIKTQKVPEPMGMREALSKFGRLAVDPNLQAEEQGRQTAQMARDFLGAADKLVTSVRLKLGGPYPKGGQNGSHN
jgi:hypothetical protein